MKILKFEDEETWMAARKGKITGSRLGDVLPKKTGGMKKGYYELIAERIATAPDGERPMERGKRLEDEAIAHFAKESGKEVNTDLVIWTRDEDESIAISPDGSIASETEGVEAKCLSSASHIEAWLTQQIPKDYEEQAIQYFCVNDKLSTLHFVFYDPRIPAKDYFVIEMKRKDVAEKVEKYLEEQRTILLSVNAVVNNLTF